MQPAQYQGLREVVAVRATFHPEVQNSFVASRIELKGWDCCRNIRGTGIALDEAKQLISDTNARIKPDDLNMFDWDMTDRDQWIFDTKMMVFLWFKEEVAPMVRQKVLDHSATGV